MPTRNLDGRSIAWREAGDGAPALLLHCALANSGALSGLMALLDDALAMRAPDLPGHGGTEFHAGRDLHDQATADARALLADRGPAHVVGHSFGATVALRVALEVPEKVASLTLIEPVFFALLADADPDALARERADQTRFGASIRSGDLRAAAEIFLGRWGAPGGLAMLPPTQVAYVIPRMSLIVASNASIVDPATAPIKLGDLATIACPVLLLAGANSPAVIHAILDAIASMIPQAHRVTVPHAGHMLPVTDPRPVSAAIRDMLGLERGEKSRDVLRRRGPVADEPRR